MVVAAIRSSEEWVAWARGPDKKRVEARGTNPHDALSELALRLKELEG